MHSKTYARKSSRLFLLLAGLLLGSCGHSHQHILNEFDRLKTENEGHYPLVHAYATYLSTSKGLDPDEAIPILSEMISFGYNAEARYCVDNLERNGIFSWDLVALRGLCYQREFQPELALSEVERALEGDPGNEKIKQLMSGIRNPEKTGPENPDPLSLAPALIKRGEYRRAEQVLEPALAVDSSVHEALFYIGMISLHQARYDSARICFVQAHEPGKEDAAGSFAEHCRNVIDAENSIFVKPDDYKGYLDKSRHLAAMGMYDQALETLTLGSDRVPENMNLLLGKALVWAQAGEAEKAGAWLDGLERKGMEISPEMRMQILKQE